MIVVQDDYPVAVERCLVIEIRIRMLVVLDCLTHDYVERRDGVSADNHGGIDQLQLPQQLFPVAGGVVIDESHVGMGGPAALFHIDDCGLAEPGISEILQRLVVGKRKDGVLCGARETIGPLGHATPDTFFHPVARHQMLGDQIPVAGAVIGLFQKKQRANLLGKPLPGADDAVGNEHAGRVVDPVAGRFGFPCLEMVSDVLLVLFGFIRVCLVSAAGVCGGDFGNFFKLFLAYIIPQTGGFFMCFAESFCARECPRMEKNGYTKASGMAIIKSDEEG